MAEYNIAVERLLNQMPARIKRLRVSPDGFPVPKFVEWINGKPDFRVMDASWLRKAWTQNLCWLCGEKLGAYLAFAIGPMCAVNRVSAEPPSHLECAEFAVKACPFLTQPNRARNVEGLPDKSKAPAGIMIERNPGVTLIWVTKNYKIFRSGNGVLFNIGEPVATKWWTKGREASRVEVLASMNAGLPALRKLATTWADSKALEAQITEGMKLIPVG